MLGAKCLKFWEKKIRDQVERCTMDPPMYKAATSGDVGFLQAKPSTDILSQKTPNGNNVLHLAAEFKQLSFFKIVSSSVGGSLVWDINMMGDTPLHIAAKAGSVELVDFLITQAKMLHVKRAGDQETGPTYDGSYKNLLRKTNEMGHTALHVAVQYGHHGVVMSLMKADPKLCCSSTKSAVESSLFLATCKGFSKIAAAILEEPSVSPSFQGVNGVTALHAAVSHRYQGAEGIVKSMVSKCPHMIKKADALGWTPLHYAAFRGNLEAVTLLMESDKSFGTSYILDKHGMTALHVAAYKGHIEVMKKLIQYQPDTSEFLNAKDQTILHVAVLGAQIDVVKYILKEPELRIRLIDQVDEEGYTPLQLAVMGQKDEITRMLRLDSGTDSTSTDKGFSLVFDNFLGEDIKTQVLEEHIVKEQEMISTESSHQARSFGVPAFQEQISRDFKKFVSNPADKLSGASAISSRTELVKSMNLLIATLIATVTFTAAITPPGGFGADGKAILRENTSFRWFQQFNLISFVFSVMVLCYESLMAYLGPRVSKVLKVVIPLEPETLTMVSLYGLIVACAMGSQAVLDKKRKPNSADYLIVAVYVVILLVAAGPYMYDKLKAAPRRIGKDSTPDVRD